ncbi:MAG TPA: hypothetical protein VIF62_06335, partial [Labilithrix sp.]
AGLLRAERGGASFDTKVGAQHASVRLARAGATRLLVLVADGQGTLAARVDGAPVAMRRIGDGTAWAGEPGELRAGPVALDLDHPAGVVAAWLVPLAAEIPPPPPRAWDAGPDTPFDAPSERGLESAP